MAFYVKYFFFFVTIFICIPAVSGRTISNKVTCTVGGFYSEVQEEDLTCPDSCRCYNNTAQPPNGHHIGCEECCCRDKEQKGSTAITTNPSSDSSISTIANATPFTEDQNTTANTTSPDSSISTTANATSKDQNTTANTTSPDSSISTTANAPSKDQNTTANTTSPDSSISTTANAPRSSKGVEILVTCLAVIVISCVIILLVVCFKRRSKGNKRKNRVPQDSNDFINEKMAYKFLGNKEGCINESTSLSPQD